jgi:hypothetical protein
MKKGIRAKGANYEREIASYFNEALGLEARRTSVTTGFITGGNFDLSGLPDLAPECKRVEALSFRSAFAQALRNARASIPIVITRRNREPTRDSLVVLRLSDFITIYRAHLLQTGVLREAPLKDDENPLAS